MANTIRKVIFLALMADIILEGLSWAQMENTIERENFLVPTEAITHKINFLALTGSIILQDLFLAVMEGIMSRVHF